MVLKLKTPWRDGTTHLVMSPLEFMQRLAAWATEGAPVRQSSRRSKLTMPDGRLRGLSHHAGGPVTLSFPVTMSILIHPGQPLVIGHRGAAAVRPENTLPSFEHAIDLGVDALEFDVRITADGVAVVHHDASTARTCGDDLLIERSTIEQLRRLDAATTFTGVYAPVTQTVIPLLDEVLALTRDMPVIIECKTVDAAPAVLWALRLHGATRRAIVGSFLHDATRHARHAGVSSGASRRDVIALVLRGLLRWAPRQLPYAAMCIPEASSGVRLPIGRFVRWGHALGIPVHIWTVNTAADANRLWDLGVTGIISDDPGTVLAARAGRCGG